MMPHEAEHVLADVMPATDNSIFPSAHLLIHFKLMLVVYDEVRGRSQETRNGF